MISLTFGLFTQVKGSGPLGPLVILNIICGNERYKFVGWLVLGFNSLLRQYFNLYRAISQEGRKRREMIDQRKNVQTTPTRTHCKRSRPLFYYYPNK